ncbi:MAG TPA: deoxyribose-phosphate aldolase [Candidatus Gastranaerophilales bacterium]|nr:deoxyribose-phosphate aldolase [Candidatus Gastranaerophilales bacterium]
MENIVKYLDQTLLLQDTSEKEVFDFCKQAKEYGFYAVCVQPYRVSDAFKVLRGSNTKIAAVAGFPCGSTFTDVKLLEAKICIEHGADEIDMVMNIGALKDGNTDFAKTDIQKMAELTKSNNVILKVIIETGLLTDEEKVLACKISAEAGADFVKTSTGMTKNSMPATVEDIKLMYETVNFLGVKVKASGGIKDYATAKAMIQAGASRIGTSSGVQIAQEAVFYSKLQSM